MYKKVIMAASAVLAAFALLLGPSGIRAYAVTPDYEPIIINSDIFNCIDDPSNSTVSGTGMQIWDGCGPSPLQGELWAGIPNAWGGFALQLANGMCLDNRGSTTNGTQYVIKTCNGSEAQAFAISCDIDGYSQIVQPNFDLVWLQGNNRSNGTKIVVFNAQTSGSDANGRMEAWWQILSSTATLSSC